MTRIQSSTALLLALSTLFMFAKSSFGGADPRTELIATETALAAAVLNLDFAVLDRTYSNDFIFTHSTGLLQTKDDWLAALRARGSSGYLQRSVDSIEVEVHGNVAITTGRIHSKTESDNPRWREYTVWYVRVYRRQENQWQLLSHRTTRDQTGPLKD